MPSLKQIEANQRNAQRSTGPRTEEGKAAVRHNALKTGIDSCAEVALPTESFHQLDLLSGEYRNRFNPVGPEQRCLVDTLVSSEWLLRRFRRIEGQLLTRSCQDVTQSAERFCLADAFDENARSLERLQCRINATQRIYASTLKLLKQLQDEYKPHRIAPARAIQPQPPEPVAAPIGFVPPSTFAAVKRERVCGQLEECAPILKPNRSPVSANLLPKTRPA